MKALETRTNTSERLALAVVQLTTIVMRVCRFQERDTWSCSQLASSLRVPLSTLRRKISFWQDQGFLRESPSVPDSWSIVEEGPRAGQGRSTDSGHGGEGGQEEEDSVTASSADQREEELGMFWSYITGMLTNLESLPLERIHQVAIYPHS